MKYFALYHPTHGIKCIVAANRTIAERTFTLNNQGQGPRWCEEYNVNEHDAVKQMARCGWHGSKADFNRSLAYA